MKVDAAGGSAQIRMVFSKGGTFKEAPGRMRSFAAPPRILESRGRCRVSGCCGGERPMFGKRRP
jgi:hypothetical protein